MDCDLAGLAAVVQPLPELGTKDAHSWCSIFVSIMKDISQLQTSKTGCERKLKAHLVSNPFYVL
jgi:hypothetical protein